MNHRPGGGLKSRQVVSKPARTGVGARAVNVKWPATVGLSRGNRVQHSEALFAKLLKGSHLASVLNEYFEEDGAAVYRAACCWHLVPARVDD